MEDFTLSGFGDTLKTYRKQKKMSQQVLASRIGVHRNTIGGWERGDFLPDSKAIVLEVAKQLHLNDHETRKLLEASLTAISPYWNVPYQRNPFFTGREQDIKQIQDAFQEGRSVALTQSYALTGLGGIGKTQLAIEYAYRTVQAHTASCWINAETTETLLSSFALTAHLLNVPEKQEQDQSKMVTSVLRWFNAHRDWLLIYDNVEDIAIIQPFLPTGLHRGHILLTTRMQVTEPVALSLSLDSFSREEGALFLLRRIRRLAFDEPLQLASPEEQQVALTLAETLGRLPLALDQAAAYILETGCLLSDYLSFYEQRHEMLLARRGNVPSDHPDSVATTFSLVFERAERQNPSSADFLRLCAFLAPDTIPEALLTKGVEQLEPRLASIVKDPLAFNEVMRTLRSLSLIQRNPREKMLGFHRLVQTVLRNEMSEDIQRQWKNNCICLLNQSFPVGKLIVDQWNWCEQLVPHILMNVLEDGAEETTLLEEASLSHKTAVYLFERFQFDKAEQLFRHALRIIGRVLGENHLDTARSWHHLAILYKEQGKYAEAEALFQQAVSIYQQVLQPNDLSITSIAMSLADIYTRQGKYAEAEVSYLRVLEIYKQAFGLNDPAVALCLNNLAVLYWRQSEYTKAESLYEEALRIREQNLGPDHPDVAQTINNLSIIYSQQGKYEQAEPFFQKALSIVERTLGGNHPDVALCLHNWGELSCKQGKYEQAESLQLRCLRIWEPALGANHPYVAHSLLALANIYREQNKFEQAKPLYERALDIMKSALGAVHPETAEVLYEFALFSEAQGDFMNAKFLYQRALAIQEQVLGLNHTTTLVISTAYACLLRKIGYEEEAAALKRRSSTEITLVNS